MNKKNKTIEFLKKFKTIEIIKNNNYRFDQLRFLVKDDNETQKIIKYIKKELNFYTIKQTKKNAMVVISILFFSTQLEKDKYHHDDNIKHQNLGKELNLFFFDYKRSNLPFFSSKFLKIINNLKQKIKLILDINKRYIEISTPKIYSLNLWKKTGHYDKFSNNLYLLNENKKVLKPMNCPGACITLENMKININDLPVRFFEFGNVFRKELAGVQQGLKRLNNFTQDDQHIFVNKQQIFTELKILINKIIFFYLKIFNKNDIKLFVSTKPKESLGNEKDWIYTTDLLKEILNLSGIDFEIDKNEGAFYGPKIDIKVINKTGKAWQLGTIQIDFNTVKKLQLFQQNNSNIFIIHSAILGSFERSLAVMLEYFNGFLPLWLWPRMMLVNKRCDKDQQLKELLIHKNIDVIESKETNLSRIKSIAIKKKIQFVALYKENNNIEILDLFSIKNNHNFKNLTDFKENFKVDEF